MANTIKIKRSVDVFRSEHEAIAFLSRTPHQPGQPVLARYWSSETETDAILAIGTQNGIGPGTYTIVSVGGVKVIQGIITTEDKLPDSSTLISGETWLYKEPVTSDLYWIYLYEDLREITPVNPEINYRVFCLSDNAEYWIYGGSLDRANNYYSREAIDRKINDVSTSITQITDELENSISSGFQEVSEVLGTSSGYPGTVPGATSFDSADQILQSRISQAVQSIQGISNRVSDLEKELTFGTEDLEGSIASNFQEVSSVLGVTSFGYPGTVPGATSFDDADRILQNRITQTSQSIQGLSDRVSDLESELTSDTEELEGSIASGFQEVSRTLGTSSGYPGTVSGAENFDDADRILQNRISQAVQSIQGISDRVLDLENELTSDTKGMAQTTRLDTLYTWYDEVTHVPSGIVEFLDPVSPLIQGSTVSITVVYRWSWASRGSWSGLRLDNKIKPFGINGVAEGNVPDGYYEWTTEVQLTEEPVTLRASFEGSNIEPVTYTLESDAIERNIVISWPTQGWNARNYTYTVTFKGSGLPASSEGNEISVTQGNQKVFSIREDQGHTQNTTYTGTIESPGTFVTAVWNPVRSSVHFSATYLIVLSKNTEITAETLEASERVWMSYQETTLFETPEITYEPDQTLVILSPFRFGELKIFCISKQFGSLTVTPDFITDKSKTIQYHGFIYSYISFSKIGAGTFKFILT